MEEAYKDLLERISKMTNTSVEEVDRRIEAKRAKLSGLISQEGAAQIVASELGVKFEGQKLKIVNLLKGMRKVSTFGKIIRLFPIREFESRGKMGKVSSFVLADEESNIRVVLWDTNHIKLIEEGNINEGSVVEISNASVRGQGERELHLSSLSNLSISQEKIEKPYTDLNSKIISKKISELEANETAKIRVTIVQVYEPRFFFVCPKCNVRVIQDQGKFVCKEHGQVEAKEKAVLTLVGDDGSSNIRITCFQNVLEKLFSDPLKLKDVGFFLKEKDGLLGKEFIFEGRIKKNKLFDVLEVISINIEEVDVKKLINELS